MERGAWRAIVSPWGRKESDATEAAEHAHMLVTRTLSVQLLVAQVLSLAGERPRSCPRLRSGVPGCGAAQVMSPAAELRSTSCVVRPIDKYKSISQSCLVIFSCLEIFVEICT